MVYHRLWFTDPAISRIQLLHNTNRWTTVCTTGCSTGWMNYANDGPAVPYWGHGHDPAHSGQSTGRTVTSFCCHNMATVWAQKTSIVWLPYFEAMKSYGGQITRKTASVGELGFKHWRKYPCSWVDGESCCSYMLFAIMAPIQPVVSCKRGLSVRTIA